MALGKQHSRSGLSDMITRWLALLGVATLCGPSNASELRFLFESNGIPRFVTTDYTELAKISRISRFRSGEGHDFSDAYESCRSMKHYFVPGLAVDWGGLKIFSPVNGVVECLRPERSFGTQLLIRAHDQPAFLFVLFHVNPTNSIRIGSAVVAGQYLGTHWGLDTSSDIAVRVATPRGEKLVSYFDVMTDALFQTYQPRGVASRQDMIISKEERDADPLTCEGESFLDRGHLPGWVDLH
jgi:hypothetical protein